MGSESSLVLQVGPTELKLIWAVLASAIISLLVGLAFVRQVLRRDPGSEAMQQVSRAIQEGARAYLFRQGKTLLVFLVLLGVALWFMYSQTAMARENAWLAPGIAIAFLMGCLASFGAGFVGMSLAVRANVRVAAAALKSFREALHIAFRAGAVSGMFTVGLGLLGACSIFLLFKESAIIVLVGFGFGGCLVALFMRVGGGIFTKAADVGADLVGKIEAGIPEDDPRNAATIADNVGDNVGDCAGMAADIFESYEVTLVAAILLGAFAQHDPSSRAAIYGTALWTFPLLVRAVGVFASILGVLSVRGSDAAEMDPMKPINVGFYTSAIASAAGVMAVSWWLFHGAAGADWWRFGAATVFGLVLAIVIGELTNYFTHTDKPPVTEIAYASKTGPATLILSGFASGLESSVWGIMAIAGSIIFSFILFGGDASLGAYGIALTGLGLLTTTGYILAMDTYGPVSDNANGIFEMSGALTHDETGRGTRIVARLDQIGNVTKALTKGFAIATAVIAAISLFRSFVADAGIAEGIRVNDPVVFVGFLIGGAVPFLFSSFAINAVARSAFQVVQEVRRQFREIPGIMERVNPPDYSRCVSIVTAQAQKELLGPGILAVFTPILVFFGLSLVAGDPKAGAAALGGYLAGAILTGQLLAVFMANAGGAWDNAKKKIEDGLFGGKGTEFHKAAVIGDTVGDPFKDTAGPALNPLIKVMNLVAILIAPVAVMGTMSDTTRLIICVISAALLVGAVTWSKRGSIGKEQAPTPAAVPADLKE